MNLRPINEFECNSTLLCHLQGLFFIVFQKLYHDVDSNDSRWIPLPRPHLADVRKPSSFQEDVYYASPRLCRGCGYLQPPNYHAPHFYSTGNVNSSGQPFLIRNEAYTVRHLVDLIMQLLLNRDYRSFCTLVCTFMLLPPNSFAIF